MYNDYPTIYETFIDQTFIYYIILGVFLLALIIFTLISVSKVYKKANRSGISAWIPFYNIKILLEIVNLPSVYFVLMLIPIVNIFVYIKICFLLAKFFRRSKEYAFGLMFLPFVFYPILAFSRSEYIGINIVAMEHKSTVVEVPNIVEEKPELTVNDQLDEGSKKLNISIGGGVYQNDYTKDLLNVDNTQAIYKNTNDVSDSKDLSVNSNNDSLTNLFVPSIEEEIKEEPKDTNTEFQNQMYNVKPITIEEEAPNIDNNVGKTPINELANEIFGESKKEERVFSGNQPIFNQKVDNEIVTCPKCGALVKGSAKVCFLCGQSLE